MGLHKADINLIKNKTIENFNTLKGIKILELGNQLIRPGQGFDEKIGKHFWTNQEMDHTSVDLNGSDGAVVKDLTSLSDFEEFSQEFDVITNCGTTEHVEPYKSQYDAFKIIDMCCKPNGLMIHIVPEITNRDIRKKWLKHCHYYYSKDFFTTLANECNYELLHLEITPKEIQCVLKKTKSSSFTISEDALLDNIAVRNQDVNFKSSTNYIHQIKK